mgnify:CR=1 FL=1
MLGAILTSNTNAQQAKTDIANESTLSNCVFVLTSYPHGDTLHIGVCELVCFNPFCNVL